MILLFVNVRTKWDVSMYNVSILSVRQLDRKNIGNSIISARGCQSRTDNQATSILSADDKTSRTVVQFEYK